jgi:hypothetical protein
MKSNHCHGRPTPSARLRWLSDLVGKDPAAVYIAMHLMGVDGEERVRCAAANTG